MELDVTQPLLLPAGGGEIIGDSANRRVEILTDHEALNATWSRFGPHRDGADPHIHRHHTDLFYVLEGELTIGLGADRAETVAPAGTLVLAPPFVVHAFRNGSDTDVRYLNFHAPGGGFADYLRGRRDGRDVSFDQEDPPEDGGRPVEDAVLRRGVGLLADIEEIGVAELECKPGDTPAPGRGEGNEWLYVLAGELVLLLGQEKIEAETGAWIHVPAGIEVAVAALGSEARYLAVRAPGRGSGDAGRL